MPPLLKRIKKKYKYSLILNIFADYYDIVLGSMPEF